MGRRWHTEASTPSRHIQEAHRRHTEEAHTGGTQVPACLTGATRFLGATRRRQKRKGAKVQGCQEPTCRCKGGEVQRRKGADVQTCRRAEVQRRICVWTFACGHFGVDIWMWTCKGAAVDFFQLAAGLCTVFFSGQPLCQALLVTGIFSSLHYKSGL